MAAIFNFGVKMSSWHTDDVKIGILVFKLLKKEVSHKFLGGLVQKLYLLDFGGGHFGFRALEKKCRDFLEVPWSKISYKWSEEVNSTIKTS